MNVRVKSAGGEDKSLACDSFRGSAYYHVFVNAIHDVGVACFAYSCYPAVLYANVSLYDACAVDDKSVCDNSVKALLVSGFADWEDYTGKNPAPDVTVTSGVLTRDNGEQDWLWNKSNPSQFACKRIKLPADSKGVVGATNFYLWWESQFETGLMGQTGLQQVALTDADDQLIAAFSLFKSDSTGNGAYVFFYGPKERYKLFIFAPDYRSNFSSRQRRGYEDILKTGDKLKFYYDGRYYETTISGLADKAVTYLYVTIGDWGERTKATDHVTVNGVGRIAGVKLNVQNWKDDPNRYKAGSEIVIDTETDAITVDGLPRNDELVTGSEFFALPPGKTKVEFYVSGWCKADPTISVEYRKRWL